MDYEKKYKKALERATELNNRENASILLLGKGLEYIFPELVESEDERIRKELVDYLTNELEGKSQLTPYTHQFKAWIAWLERQSEDARNDSQIWQIANNSAKTWEQSFAILNAARKAYNKGKKDALKGQKPAEWRPIDAEYMNKLCEIIDEYDAETTTKCCWKNWLKSLKKRIL